MSEFALPWPLHTSGGAVRRVGVELEFGGLELAEAAEAVRAAFGNARLALVQHADGLLHRAAQRGVAFFQRVALFPGGFDDLL